MEISFHLHLDFDTVIAKKLVHGTTLVLSCGMYKNVLRSDGQQQNYNKEKFPTNSNYRQKIVTETGLRYHRSKTL